MDLLQKREFLNRIDGLKETFFTPTRDRKDALCISMLLTANLE